MSQDPMPNGRLDRIKAGPRSITIQTEFFPRPNWRIETKIYVDGALKKLETEVLTPPMDELELQKVIDRFHEKVAQELAGKLRNQQEGKGA